MTIDSLPPYAYSSNTDDRQYLRYRVGEALPGVLSWVLIFILIGMAMWYTSLFAFLVMLFMAYWIINAASIVVFTKKGLNRISAVRTTDWISRLEAERPEWRDYRYMTIIPFAGESIRVLRPTLEALAASNFPRERLLVVLSSEAAKPEGKKVAEQLAAEFAGRFGRILLTEHTLKSGELKGKASNENHAGRFAYDALLSMGIDPNKVLVSSNDADMQIEPQYPGYLLYSYLSEGPHRDKTVYQPVPADLSDYWNASFFTRMLTMSGVLWRITLQVHGGLRHTVFSFYSMSMKTLRDIGFWDVDVIPEDERTMFKGIASFGKSFKVKPLYIMVKGVSIRGDGLASSVLEQYTQIRRWAWGASEIAHSLSVYKSLDPAGRRVMASPILNQIRTAVEWSLAPLILVFGGFLPNIVNPIFNFTSAGRIFAFAMTIFALISTFLLLCTIRLERLIAPPRSDESRTFIKKVLDYAQWFLSPVVSLAFGALPALEAQTRLIFNSRIAYVESRKE